MTTIASTRSVNFEPSARIRSTPSENAADPRSWISAWPLNR
jgi:hypothetical protein